MQKQINFIEDLSRSDLDLLAQLFSFPNKTNDPSANTPPFPPDSWLASQSDALSSFPQHLLRPTSLLPKLALKLPFGAAKAVLCSAHKPLNPVLARRLFMQLCAEAGLRVQNLITAAEREDSERDKRERKGVDGDWDGDDSEKGMGPEVRAWLRRLTTLNSLWMSAATYRTKFHAMPDEQRFERVEGGCMACILAFVGGNAQIVLDLRTSLLGRRKRGHESRLWGLVDAWTWSNREAEQIRHENERVGKLVMRERRRIRRRRRRERRERRRNRKSDKTAKSNSEGKRAAVRGGNGADDFDDEPGDAIGDFAPRDEQSHRDENERDFEGSIIDFYRDTAGVDEDLHPVFRNSVAYDPTSGTFSRRPQQPSNSQRAGDRAGATSRRTFYTQSAYSQDVGLDSDIAGSTSAPSHFQGQGTLSPAVFNPFVKTSSSRNARDKHIAEKRAESYQKLVGIPEENPTARAPPSEEAMREYMRGLWEPQTGGANAEEDEKAEEEARNARVQKALADAYGDRSKTGIENNETKESHLTTWSSMMKKGGAKNWFGF